MHEFDLKSLYGQPIEAALERLREKNIEYNIVQYVSPRGPLGDDWRVLRAEMRGDAVELVVSGFCTEINGEKIG